MDPPDETAPLGHRPDDPSAAAALQRGDILASRYEIRRFLGKGGMGAVYEAQDHQLGLAIALKTLAPVASLADEGLRNLKREVLLARQVTHENVCRLHDLEWDEGRGLFFATMELLRGESLADLLDREGAIEPGQALPLIEQMASGLEAAHRAGVVHRDFKAANVMLVQGDRAVLTDFGIAGPVAAEDAQSARADHVEGTPAYMAPEQLRGDPVGPAADVYALGVVIFEMVTSRLPFEDPDPRIAALKRLEEDAPSPREHVPGLPEVWEETVLRCRAREPAGRFRGPGQVISALKGHPGGARAARAAPGNLPAERDAFVGREADLRELHGRLEAGSRLLSLLGLGGTGKTRLALRLAHEHRARWPGGAWFCDLSEARSADGIVQAVARALDVPLVREDPARQLGHAIAGRGRCLLILDNFEQVARHAGETLGRWLDLAADAQFLVTTREVLGLAGEEAFALAPLAGADAEELFLQRARAVKRDLAPTEDDLETVSELVLLLDRLPLAIEIAAARTAMLTPKQILERAGDRFRLLTSTGGRRDRQATLRATLDWSWDLLAGDEQAALGQLSVFEGGFTAESADAVLLLEDLWPVDALQSLFNKSLVRKARHDRFDLLVTVQEYAAGRLEERGEAEAARVRHGRHMARYGTESAIEELSGPGGADRRKSLVREYDNLAAACLRAVARKDGPVAVSAFAAAWSVLSLRGPFSAGVDLGRQVLDLSGLDPEEEVRCLGCLGSALSLTGRNEEAREAWMDAIAIARRIGDRRSEGIMQGNLGSLHRNRGRIEDARERYDKALAIHREVGNRRHEGIVLGNLGILHMDQGRLEEAREHLEKALAIHRESGSRHSEGLHLGNLGILHMNQGRLDEAREHYEEALSIHRETGNRHSEGVVLGNLGILHIDQDRMEEAREHYERALAVHREVGNRHSEGIVHGNLGNLHLRGGGLEAAREHYGKALAIHREVGNRRSEGIVHGNLGNLHREQGRQEEARADFERGEAVLRELGEKLALGNLLCARGRLDLETGDLPAARNALDEAASLAEATRSGPDSELGRAVAGLREALAAP